MSTSPTSQSESTRSEPARAGQQRGGYILTASLIVTAVLSIAVDLNATHLFNPSWPGHAKFHDAAMLNLLAGTTLLALWLLWRRGREPHVATLVAALVPVIFWSAFFWATWILPGTDLHAGTTPPPKLGGIPIHINVIIAFLLSALSIFGLWLNRRQYNRAGAPRKHP